MNIACKPLVMITRPEAEALDFARDAVACGFEPLICPVLEIEAVAHAAVALGLYDALIFTSVNAVRHFQAAGAAALPVYCVGAQTAALAREAGYKVEMMAPTGAALAKNLHRAYVGRALKLLYVRGCDVAFDLEAALADFVVTPLIVYSANPAPSLTPAGHEALANNEIQAVSFFSKRTAKTFMEIIAKEKLEATLSGFKALCISQSVLECVQPQCWQEVYVSATPDRIGMMDVLRTLKTDLGKC